MGKTLMEMQAEFMEKFKGKTLEELASLCGVEFGMPRTLGVMGVMLDKLFLDSVKDTDDFKAIPVSYIGGAVKFEECTLLIEPHISAENEVYNVLYLHEGNPDRLGVLSSNAIRYGFVNVHRTIDIGTYLELIKENDKAK